MHPRTLHRELAKSNTSFVKLKDTTRRALAQYYLLQNHYSIATISALLGYQEQATLCASVKRWFGCSARAYRAKKMIN
jgi:AraC-like DNA-binding protein